LCESRAAFDLLNNTRFHLVHQRYERTRLWRKIETSLELKPVEYSSWLGEDDVAEFGPTVSIEWFDVRRRPGNRYAADTSWLQLWYDNNGH
jgi:hypothetical protein